MSTTESKDLVDGLDNLVLLDQLALTDPHDSKQTVPKPICQVVNGLIIVQIAVPGHSANTVTVAADLCSASVVVRAQKLTSVLGIVTPGFHLTISAQKFQFLNGEKPAWSVQHGLLTIVHPVWRGPTQVACSYVESEVLNQRLCAQPELNVKGE